MKNSKSVQNTTLDKLFQSLPGLEARLSRLGLACAGCPMAPFETPRDVSRAYKIPLGYLISTIQGQSMSPKEQS